MGNFITKLQEIKVASSNHGVTVTDQFENINGNELLGKLNVCSHGIKDGSHWLRTALKVDDVGNCMPRSNGNAESVASMLIIDCDKRITSNGEEKDGAPDPHMLSDILKRHNIGHVIHGSYSHYSGDVHRCRIVLLTSELYNHEQLPPTAEAIVVLINIELALLGADLLAYAKENNAWAQPWYFPRRPVGCEIQPLYFEHLEGQLVNVVDAIEVLDLAPVLLQVSEFNTDEISPIEAFNAQNDLVDVLIKYGYKRVLKTVKYEKWLSPDSTSGRAGITVENGKFFSHHNDVFNDQHWHDCFDLMRVREGLTVHAAIIKAAEHTLAPDGRTVDTYNKSLLFKNKAKTHHVEKPLNISFEDYQPFNDELLPVESVPYEALPDQMAHFIKEQSLIRGCPPDYILVSLLARMGCVFSGKIKIALTRNSGWYASPNFFWLMVGDPSSGKSNALSATNRPIQTLESLARELYKKEYREFKADMDSLERQLIAAKKGVDAEGKKATCDYSKIGRFEDRIKELQQKIYDLEDNKPKLKHYTVSKLTVEKLILILEENPGGVLLELDELTSLFVRLSKDENSEERGLYLSGYNGTVSYSYKTISRGDVLIPNIILSIIGGIQPKKLKRFIHEAKNGYQDDGLLQRFQGVVFPDRTLYLPEDRQSETNLTKDLEYLFQNLESIPTSIANDLRHILQFDDSAQSIFDEWRTEATRDAHKLNNPLDAHVGKSYEFIASLSAYLYLYENNGQLAVDKKIPPRHVLCAIKLGKYFLSHAKRMYGLAYQDDISARSLSEKLAKLVLSPNNSDHHDTKTRHYFFTRSQIRTKGWSDLNTKEQRREAINCLIERGYISKAVGERYFINPDYLNE